MNQTSARFPVDHELTCGSRGKGRRRSLLVQDGCGLYEASGIWLLRMLECRARSCVLELISVQVGLNTR